MRKSLNIIIGNQGLMIIKIADDVYQEQYLISSLDDLENNLPEIIRDCEDDIKILIDTSEQNFAADTLLSVTEQSLFHSIKGKANQSYNQTNMIGYFIIKNQKHIQNQIITVSIPKNSFISAVFEKLKMAKGHIKSIISSAVELQQICCELKKEYVTIQYDQSEGSIRTFAEYDIYVMMSSMGIVRYIIFKNDTYYSNSHTALDLSLEEETLLDVIHNNIDNLLRKLDPSINDQLNMFICLNKAQLNRFTQFASKVDRLILVEIDKLAKNLGFTIQGEDNNIIAPILAFFLDHHQPITNVLDCEYHHIIKLENYNRFLRWPTLFISCALLLSILLNLLTDRYYEKKATLVTNQITALTQQINAMQREQDFYLSGGNLNQLFKVYQEIASYQTPFSLFKDLISVRSHNLEYIDIFWTNSNNESIMGSIYNNVTIIANIRTDNNHSFEKVINDFTWSLINQNTSYIVDYSRPQNQMNNIGNGENNPLIIKIRCVSKK